MSGGVGALAELSSASPRVRIAIARSLRSSVEARKSLDCVAALGDRLRRMNNRAIQLRSCVGRAFGQQVRRRLELQQQTVKTLKQRIVQLPRDARPLVDAFVEASR